MVYGHNTNLTMGRNVFHIQTEDRGEIHALIDTTVYYHGRVLHRRTNNYFDLLPLNEDREGALKLRVEDQHQTVIEEIRSGVLELAIPPTVEAPGAPAVAVREAVATEKLLLELTNAKNWLSGKRAKLQLVVRGANGEPVPGAQIRVQVEGSDGVTVDGKSGEGGLAEIEFDMPRVTGEHAALVIQAENHATAGQLRFALRAKPRVA